jgi:heparan-alpha-glucosaminide N-acetyltransferase
MAESTILIHPRIDNLLTTDRIYSIDALRGITILVMIFVNQLAGVKGLPWWLKHAAADADTMTFVDVVFPAFLFIVGMSIPFAIANRLSKGDGWTALSKHIAIRTIGLLTLGVFMVNAEAGYDEDLMVIPLSLWSLLFFICSILIWNNYSFKNERLSQTLRIIGILGLVVLFFVYKKEDGASGLAPQWWGILGLIGWAYFFSCILYLASRGSAVFLLFMIAICILFFAVGKENEYSSNAVLQFMNAQKGHATHISLVLAGIVVSLFVFDDKLARPLKIRIFQTLLFGAACFMVGFFLRPFFTISKILATPSWAMFSVTICVVLFCFLFWLIDLLKINRWTQVIQPSASNPLLAYTIPYIVLALMGVLHLSWPQLFSHGIPGLIWSLIYALIIMGIVKMLNRAKIKLQL